MECLPVYTHGGEGVTGKLWAKQDEWVAVVNTFGEVESADRAESPHLDVKVPPPNNVHAKANIHLTESVTVECAVVDEHVGRMTEESFQRLHELRAGLDRAARR